jgi:hypothetical protein
VRMVMADGHKGLVRSWWRIRVRGRRPAGTLGERDPSPKWGGAVKADRQGVQALPAVELLFGQARALPAAFTTSGAAAATVLFFRPGFVNAQGTAPKLF